MPDSVIRIRQGDALIIVDVQNDFLPGGALGVPDGDAVIPILDRYIDHFTGQGLPVYATRDWHPSGHCSFTGQGGPWPPHCLAGSDGAAFAANLALPVNTAVISKGTLVEKDAYSGFDGTTLHSQLQHSGIDRLFIGGLATDYCVSQTVLDALTLKYPVFLLIDAVRAVDVEAGDGERAVAEMEVAGALPLTLEQLA